MVPADAGVPAAVDGKVLGVAEKAKTTHAQRGHRDQDPDADRAHDADDAARSRKTPAERPRSPTATTPTDGVTARRRRPTPDPEEPVTQRRSPPPARPRPPDAVRVGARRGAAAPPRAAPAAPGPGAAPGPRPSLPRARPAPAAPAAAPGPPAAPARPAAGDRSPPAANPRPGAAVAAARPAPVARARMPAGNPRRRCASCTRTPARAQSSARSSCASRASTAPQSPGGRASRGRADHPGPARRDPRPRRHPSPPASRARCRRRPPRCAPTARQAHRDSAASAAAVQGPRKLAPCSTPRSRARRAADGHQPLPRPRQDVTPVAWNAIAASAARHLPRPSRDPVRALYPAGTLGGSVVGFVGREASRRPASRTFEDGACRARRASAGRGGQRGHRSPSGASRRAAVDGSDVRSPSTPTCSGTPSTPLAQRVGDQGRVRRGRRSDVEDRRDVGHGVVPELRPGNDSADRRRQLGNPPLRRLRAGLGHEGGDHRGRARGGRHAATPSLIPNRIQAGDRGRHRRPRPRAVDWTVTGILAKSSNVGTIMLARERRREARAYFRAFGLGAATGIGLPG